MVVVPYSYGASEYPWLLWGDKKHPSRPFLWYVVALSSSRVALLGEGEFVDFLSERGGKIGNVTLVRKETMDPLEKDWSFCIEKGTTIENIYANEELRDIISDYFILQRKKEYLSGVGERFTEKEIYGILGRHQMSSPGEGEGYGPEEIRCGWRDFAEASLGVLQNNGKS